MRIPQQPEALEPMALEEQGRREQAELIRKGFTEEAALHFLTLACRVAAGMLRTGHPLIEDAGQETLTRTIHRWERANRYGNPDAWVVRTTQNVCKEMLRKEKQGARPTAEDSDTDDCDHVAEWLLVDAAIKKLSRRQRDVVVCHFLVGYSIADTAHILGLKINQVRNACEAGLKRLRKILGEDWTVD